MRDIEADLKEKIREISQKWKTEQEAKKSTVTEEEIAYIVSSWTGVPVTKLNRRRKRQTA